MQECKKRCFCAVGDCNKTSGHCPTYVCSAGYSRGKCDTPCDDEHYGQNCKETCGKCVGADVCYKDNGTCPNGCEAGYEGNTCTDACNDENYGQNCNGTCGKCFGSEGCNTENGTCPNGCEAGYEGSRCIHQCWTRTFGFNCKQRCEMCLDRDECDIYTGECQNGCIDEYKGTQCLQEINQVTTPCSDTGISLPVFIGSLLAVIGLYTTVTLVLVWLLCRMRLQKKTENEENRTDTSIQLSNTPSNYDTLELDNLREESKYTELNRIS